MAVAVTLVALAAAVLATILGYRLQLQRALTPDASTGLEGSARLQRAIARAFAGRHQVARAAADFIVTTIARNRAQQMPIVINAAIGLTIAVAALSRPAGDATFMTGLRTAVLWVPLLAAYWIAIGLRASFFVPSELPAAWSIRANGPDHPHAYWAAIRAAAIAVIVPPAILTTLLLVPLLGWRVAAAHAFVVCAMALLFAEWVALTIDFIPFTRAYQTGHARLKSRWPLYLFGVWACAFWPARFELWMAGRPAPLLALAAAIAVVVALLELKGRRAAAGRSARLWEEPVDEADELTVLGIATAARSAVGA